MYCFINKPRNFVKCENKNTKEISSFIYHKVKKMDEQIREFVKQTYHEAIASFDIEHLAKTLEQTGIDSTDPEVSALLRELDKEYGIY